MGASRIVPIIAGACNCFLLQGRRSVLVDTGLPLHRQRILDALDRGLGRDSLSLIFLTHAHSDHAGCAAALRKLTGAPVAIFAPDDEGLRRGVNVDLVPWRTKGRLAGMISNEKSGPWAMEPDFVWHEEQKLDEYGIDAMAVPTPGHTRGSGSVLWGEDAVVGDLTMAGYLFRKRFSDPFFVADGKDWHESKERIINTSRQIWVGHGGPVLEVSR